MGKKAFAYRLYKPFAQQCTYLKFCFIKKAHRATCIQCLWAAAAHSWRTQSFAPKMAGRDSFMGVYLANLQPHHIQKVVRVYIYSGRSRGVSNDPNS